MTRWTLMVVLLWAVVGFGQAPAAPVAWEADWVEFGASPSARQSDVNGKDVEQPAGAYQTRRRLWRERPDMVGIALGMEYQLAAQGALPKRNAVICCAGVLFPLKTFFELVEYAREGKEIRLVLRQSPANEPALKRAGKATQVQLFARAEIPVTLEKGEYDFVFTVVQDSRKGREVTAGPVRITVQIPPAPIDNVNLKALSDEELLREYVARGEACKGTGAYPSDWRFVSAAMISYEHPARLRWDLAAQEVRRRGGEIIPKLIEMLPAEVQRNAGQDGFGKFGFGFDIIEAMGEIGDPRPVPLLVEILGGKWNSNTSLRDEALRSAQKLTYVRFYGPDDLQSGLPEGLSLEHRDRLPKRPRFGGASKEDYIAQMAPLYRTWLRDEGPRPEEWLNLARRRAREILAGDDPEEIKATIAFLQKDDHDDAPEKTLAQLMQLLEETQKTGGAGRSPQREWKGKKLPTSVNWVGFLPHYGSKARPAVPTLIKQMEDRSPGFSFLNQLAEIGGAEAMEYCVSKLPRLARAARGQPETDESGRHNQQVLALGACRWAIEQMAGRTFDDDAQVRKWWEQNRDLPPRQWLEDSLMLTAQKADAEDARAQALLRMLVPDLPNAEGDQQWFQPGHSGSRRPAGAPLAGPFRARWLEENRAKLLFDDTRSQFRLE